MQRSLSASRDLLKVFRALKTSSLTSSFHGESLPVRVICSRQSFPFTLRGLTTSPILSAESAEGSSSNYKEIIVTKEGGLLTITLNRPKKYNAINYQVRGSTRIASSIVASPDP